LSIPVFIVSLACNSILTILLSLGICRASGGADGPDRIFVGGLPYYLSEEQIMDLLSSFG
jgi:hypothetical protein